jgi:hypothetical protein
MRNLNKPPRYNVASVQVQKTLGGDVMQSHEQGDYVEFRDYQWLLTEKQRLDALTAEMDKTINASQAECRRLKAEVERLTFVDDFIVITRASIKQLIEEGVQNKSGEYEERYLIRVNKDEYIKVLKHISEFWEDAKEGKQS